MYNITVWELAVPTARRLYADDTVAVNRGLLKEQLGWLKCWRGHRGLRLFWLCWNALHAVSESAKLLATNVAVLLGLSWCSAACTALAVIHRAHGSASMHRTGPVVCFAKCTYCSGSTRSYIGLPTAAWSCWWSRPSFGTWSPGTCCCPRHWLALWHSTQKPDHRSLANDEHLVLETSRRIAA